MKSKSYCIYEVSAYSSEYLFNRLRENNLNVEAITKVDEYLYHIKINYKQEKLFLKHFKDAKLIYNRGLFYIIKRRLIQKLTIISFVISIAFFSFLTTRIYKVIVNGNNSRINDEIWEKLETNDVEKYSKIPSKETIEKIKGELIIEHEEIENIDITIRGTVVTLTYFLKEKENIHIQYIGKYIAKKNGMIAYADIEKGNFLCHTNQYVKKGELLIDDYLHLDDKSIYVGAFGKVYAYTWYTISLSIDSNGLEESEAYSFLVSQCRYNIAKDFEENEKIENEKVLNFLYEKKLSSIKIHYTLFENIAILVEK